MDGPMRATSTERQSPTNETLGLPVRDANAMTATTAHHEHRSWQTFWMDAILVTAAYAIFCLASQTCFSQSDRSGSRTGSTGPTVYKSKNFHVMTDLPKEEAEDLMKRLESMLTLMSRYWGAPNRRVIEMYVVKDMKNWPAGTLKDPEGIASIRRKAGVTIGQTAMVNGRAVDAKSVVYAIANRGTPQHEAVHAYCTNTFGRTGPTWYSEGMAEVGNYWADEKDKSVNCHPGVIRYLNSTDPKPLKELVDRNQVTGDSWQAYGERWALCHMLGFNPNYSKRFKPLGLGLLNNKRGASFWAVYGSMAEEIQFEYSLFVKDVETGYRSDLCYWDWKTKFSTPRGRSSLVSRIRADRGWQGTRLDAKKDMSFEFSTDGTWRTTKDGDPVSAAGNAEGIGKLVGVWYADFAISEPFDLGELGTLTAPADGRLYVRCNDTWGSIGDNLGTVTLKIKRADD